MRHLLSLPSLTVSGAIDILVVAFLVYQALMVVRGTRAGHVLLGITFMALLYAGAVWGRLEALRSLLLYIVPSLPRGLWDAIMKEMGKIPRHCRSCGRRFYIRPEAATASENPVEFE